MRCALDALAAIALLAPGPLAACGDDDGAGGLAQDAAVTSPDIVAGDADAAPADTAAPVDTGAPDDTAAPADTTAPTDTATPDGPKVTIVVEGDLEDRSPADGLASQTPSVYRYGLQRLELLRALDDPAPAVIFDYAPDYVVVDMLDRNIVATVPMATLPSGAYPYFRIVLTHMEARVDASLHGVPVVGDLAAPLDLLYALSDLHNAVYDMDQGDAVVSANFFGTPYSVPTHWGVPAPNPSPGATAEAVDGEWRVTFPVAPAFVPSPETPVDVTYTVRFFVTEGFRWRDLSTPGYTAGAWDVTVAPAAAFEPVERFGANAYEVDLELP